MLVQPDNLRLASCVGLHEAKQLLREAIILPLTFPHLFSGRRQPWQRILLYGPPGTGQEFIILFHNTMSCVDRDCLIGKTRLAHGNVQVLKLTVHVCVCKV